MIELDKIYNDDCLNIFPKIEDNSIDVILTDPPYLYLKNQRLERPFDEVAFFSHSKRVLKNEGFLVFFGRGESFYRWNSIASQYGFKFKEEIIWAKGRSTSPCLPLARVHETMAVYSKSSGTIRRSYIPYFEKRDGHLEQIITDIKRLRTVLGNIKELSEVQTYLESGNKTFKKEQKITKFRTSVQNTGISSRCVNVLAAMRKGCLESDVIEVQKNTRKCIHPTQKPERLLERVLSLVSMEGAIVLDPFCGSGSTCLAAQNMNRHFIGVEIDKIYFEDACKHLKEQKGTQLSLFD